LGLFTTWLDIVLKKSIQGSDGQALLAALLKHLDINVINAYKVYNFFVNAFDILPAFIVLINLA